MPRPLAVRVWTGIAGASAAHLQWVAPGAPGSWTAPNDRSAGRIVARRLPSNPPNLPGFAFIRVLGSGGFADVFLYEQNMPRRLVAVKVLLAEVVTDDLRQMFQAEANLMAQLSSHPSILTVYQASVAADGRPYLVMEYCSATLGQRYRAVQLPIAEVLSIGVRIASAVETAHRQGVLHRDIKPSNILTTAYGHPVLSDFGIAATLGEAESSDAVGLSIPWSAPEVLHDDVSGSVASEVWSLGATVYSLLAGRSPFEVPGGDNSSAQLMARIDKARPAATGRVDVPKSLERVLARAMSRRPADRQSSALEFIRDLQAAEEELGLPQTPLEVAMDDWAIATAVDVDDRTRINGSHSLGGVGRRRRRAAAGSAGTAAIGESGVHESASGRGRPSPPSTRRLAWGISIVAALLVALVGAGVYVAVQGTRSIPVVSDVQASVDGTAVTFSWNDPGLANGDAYIVTIDGQPSPMQREPTYAITADDGDRVCVSVTVTRDGKSGESSAQRCVDVEESR
jgi:tRNA A-37 threonylcarbamoyl transferase component Bud32